MDLVVVAFPREFASLLLQARSLARGNARDIFGRYLILWNEATPEAELDQRFRPRLERELRGAGLPWQLIPRGGLLEEAVAAGASGYRTQQALKLAVARHVATPRYCVLDSKNHQVRPLARRDFEAPDGRIRSHRQTYSPGTPFGDRLAAALAFFGLPAGAAPPGQGLPSTTPMILPAAPVRDLLAEVERREGAEFGTAFLTHPRLTGTTEFLLWYAYLLSRPDLPPEALYAFDRRIYVTFFNTSPQGEAAITGEIARMDAPEVKFLGLHRGRFPRLTPAERAAFTRAWLAAGLFATEADCAAFMERGLLGRAPPVRRPGGAAPNREPAP